MNKMVWRLYYIIFAVIIIIEWIDIGHSVSVHQLSPLDLIWTVLLTIIYIKMPDVEGKKITFALTYSQILMILIGLSLLGFSLLFHYLVSARG